MRRLEAITVISRAYLPHARVLADSLSQHHRNLRLSVVIVDAGGASATADEPFELISPLALGIDERELHRRALLFDAQGLVSSLRPLALRHLLDRGARAAVLIDADMLALGKLDDLWRAAARAGVLLSPHSPRPLAGERGDWPEEVYLRAGTFNGGLLGVGARGSSALEWLAQRVARDCVRDPARGLLYSQTWLNLVPALFPCEVISDLGVNLQFHRLAGADLGGSPEAPQTDDVAVRLFHFCGFDPASPGILSGYVSTQWGRLEGRPVLSEFCERYAALLRARGWPEPAPYGWGALPNGRPVDDVIRSVYRGALLAAERGLCPEPPDPFDRANPERFPGWLREPPSELSRYMLGLRELRGDLREAFARVPGEQTPGFLAWFAAEEGKNGRSS